MENLIDYILHVIMTCDLKVKPETVLGKPAWRFLCEDSVLFIFDQVDVQAFRDVYNLRYEYLTDDEKAEYERFFSLCV